ncbi:hypothetical protein BOX15_Mlig032673g3 [Macrostomum lignano]|uniref:Major facilitator superfamily (MFS) profile domain-containing protein n=1 Tax=Macrostomum lignano TaxID=282301 RepID=A0A267FST2_9PLAT|nr:hypothetical protein BOX15_Mlig032673g3 [Macrostomum lignano]
MLINKDLIKPKILYFLFLSIVSSLIMYLNMFLMQRGINEFELGLIDTVGYIVGFLMRPVCGAVADRYQAYRPVLLALMLLSAAGFDGMLLLPQPLQAAAYNETFSIVNASYNDTGYASLCLATDSMTNNSYYQAPISLCNCKSASKDRLDRGTITRLNFLGSESDKQCILYEPASYNYSAKFVSNNSKLICKACQLTNSSSKAKSNWNVNFLLALVLKTIGLAGYSPLLCLLDAVTFSLLGPKPSDYGWTRMYGSFGIFITALLTGFALYGYSMAWSFRTDYTASFILATVLLAVAAAVTVTLKVPTSTRTLNPLKALPLMCLSWRIGIFYILVLLSGAAFGIFESFLAVMLRTMFDPPLYFFGIMFAVQVLVEAPLFALSGCIVSRIGEPACFVIGFLAFALRFLLTSLVPNCWLLLPVNCLHGLSFGLMFPAMLVFAAKQAPEGWQGTVQGLVSGLYFGVGQALGVPAAGALIHIHGNRPTLRIWSGASLAFGAVAACHMVAMRIWPDQQPSAMSPITEVKGDDVEDKTPAVAGPGDQLLEPTVEMGPIDDANDKLV